MKQNKNESPKDFLERVIEATDEDQAVYYYYRNNDIHMDVHLSDMGTFINSKGNALKGVRRSKAGELLSTINNKPMFIQGKLI